MPNSVAVRACPSPFSTARVDMAVPEGTTLAGIMEMAQPIEELRRRAVVSINGDDIAPALWSRVRPKHGALVTIRVFPAGGGDGGGAGKNILRAVLAIVVIVVSVYFGQYYGATAAAEFGFGSAAAWSAGITAVGSAVGTLAVNALIRIPPQRLPALSGQSLPGRDSPTLFISGGRNAVNRWGVVPRVLGRHRMVPPFGALPYTEIAGDDQYLRLLFAWGYGPLEVTNLRIGETDLDEFEGVEVFTRQGYDGDPPLQIYTSDVYEDALSVLLEDKTVWATRTTQPNTEEISIDIFLPGGLVKINDDGTYGAWSSTVEIQYAPTGTAAWVVFGGEPQVIKGKQTTALRRNYIWPVPSGQYDVRVRRNDTPHDRHVDDTVWAYLRSIRRTSPINMPNIATTEVRIRATGQLNGIVDSFNGVVQSIVPDWDNDTGTWITRATSNPASLFRAVLQSSGNRRPMADSQIDLDDLQDWHGKCGQNGWAYNGIVDYASSVADVLIQVSAAGRASPAGRDGKRTIVIDEPQSLPVQHFTPRNSWNFSSVKTFVDSPHAWRVRFVNELKDWDQDEVIVYDDGYSEENATVFEVLDAPGMTHPDQVWKYGRYYLAAARLRPETYSFSCDVEHIVCTRGDLIRVAHDIPLWGTVQARVTAVVDDGTYTTAMTLDEPVEMGAGKLYTARVRRPDGQSILLAIGTDPLADKTVALSTPILVDDGPAVGDLVLVGETGAESVELVVKSIRPGPDMTARIDCVDAAPAIHNADAGDIPEFVSNITLPAAFQPPVVLGVRSDESVVLLTAAGAFVPRVVFDLAPPSGNIDPDVSVMVRPSGTDAAFARASIYERTASSVSVTGVETRGVYDFRVAYTYEGRIPTAATAVNGYTVVGLSTPPPELDEFSIAAVGGAALLRWKPIETIDVRYGGKIVFRHSPAMVGAVWAASTSIGESVRGAETLAWLPLKEGTYLAQVVDAAGNRSAVSSLPTKQASVLTFVNVTSIDEGPTFAGAKTNVVLNVDHLRLAGDSVGNQAVFSDILLFSEIGIIGTIFDAGRYDFNAGVDLATVKGVRVTSIVDAVGINTADLIGSRGPISTWESITGAAGANVDAWVEMRFTDDDPAGTPDWSAWRRVDASDVESRGFEFRCQMRSYEAPFNIQVNDLGIRIAEI